MTEKSEETNEENEVRNSTKDTPKEIYENLRGINLDKHISEIKNRGSYVTWSIIHKVLKEQYPQHVLKVHHHNGFPYVKDENGFVYTTITIEINGYSHTETMDCHNGNRPIKNPDASAVYRSIQRTKVKCAALHGLGLYLWHNIKEDLNLIDSDTQSPSTPSENSNNEKPIDKTKEELAEVIQTRKDELKHWMTRKSTTGKKLKDIPLEELSGFSAYWIFLYKTNQLKTDKQLIHDIGLWMSFNGYDFKLVEDNQKASVWVKKQPK